MNGPRWLPAIMLALIATTFSTACGTRAPLATSLVDSSRLEENVVIGVSTKAQVLAQLGPTTHIRFDSGYEVWLYKYTNQALGHKVNAVEDAVEFVILFDPDGVVKKIRRRAPPLAAAKTGK